MSEQDSRYSTAAVPAPIDEDTDLVYEIARSIYEHQAKTRNFTPQPEPYSPSWSFDYSRIAIKIIRDYDGGQKP